MTKSSQTPDISNDQAPHVHNPVSTPTNEDPECSGEAASPAEHRHVPAFMVGRWRADPDRCCVSADGRTVHLRPQLMEVLVYLAERAGRVVLKEELLAEVWGGRFVTESCLTRCVAQLREVLEDQPHEGHYIETIPKRGYRLAAVVHDITSPELPAARQSMHPGRGGQANILVAALAGMAVGFIFSRLVSRHGDRHVRSI